MKKYLVTIKEIRVTSMILSENTADLAVRKVDKFLHKCLDNKISLDKTFTDAPVFKYKVSLVKNTEKI